MSAFRDSCLVEKRGLEILKPYIDQISSGNRVYTAKGGLSKHLQSVAGDVLINDSSGDVVCFEIKIERKHTGNLFLEVWSNRNLDDIDDYRARGQNPGWMVTCRADAVLFYFLDTDDLYTVNFFALKRWAFGFRHPGGEERPRLYKDDSRFKSPGVSRDGHQLNDTWGYCVPVETLRTALRSKFSHCKVKQLSLLQVAA